MEVTNRNIYGEKPGLVMQEYGRHVQAMVDHCKTIEDRNLRNRCARTIIDAMGKLFPDLRDADEFKHIFWDHLAIMSNFELDIDYPCDVIKSEKLYEKPRPVPYPEKRIRYMHYGAIIQELIQKCSVMEEGRERRELAMSIANMMKKCYFIFNKEVDDKKIITDLRIMSLGTIDLPNDTQLLNNKETLKIMREVQQLHKSQMKKKKK